MNNELTLERFCVWEEKNLIGPETKLESSGSVKPADTINEIKSEFVKKGCEDIGKIKLKRLISNENARKRYHKNIEKERERYQKRKQNPLYQQKRKEYHKKNSEKIKEKRKEYFVNLRKTNSYKKRMREYIRNRRKNDIDFRISKNLGVRIHHALTGLTKKSERTEKLLGCSIIDFKKYIQSLFIDEMNWNNYGEWHIDHIMPCSSFDLTKEEEQKKCFHYTNLQPLWKKDNIIKNDFLPDGKRARDVISCP